MIAEQNTKIDSYFSDRIDEQYRRVINDYLSSTPVLVGELARALGLNVVLANLPLNISGMIKPENDGYLIKVNRFDSKERQRFTIAHEIAHFLLHRDKITGGVVDSALYRSKLSSRLEAEANKLAADIIMPRKLIGLHSEQLRGVSFEQRVSLLSEKFRVSKSAMEIRLE